MLRCQAKTDNIEGFKDLCLKNGSSQGQHLALAVLFVLNSLDSESGVWGTSDARAWLGMAVDVV